MESSSYHCSHTQRRGGLPSRRKPGSKSLRRHAQRACRIHTGRRASHQVVAAANRASLEIEHPVEVNAGIVERERSARSYARRALRNGAKANVVGEELDHATDELSGVVGGDMMAESGQRKLGTTRGQPRRTRTAKASRISRTAAKSWCVSEWGGWGRISVDGPGYYNPDRSEDPWGRGTMVSRTAVLHPSPFPTLSGIKGYDLEGTKDADKPREAKGMPGVGLTGPTLGKVPSERLTLKPYWGKPAVRNFRGDAGNGLRQRIEAPALFPIKGPAPATPRRLPEPRLRPTRPQARSYLTA